MQTMEQNRPEAKARWVWLCALLIGVAWNQGVMKYLFGDRGFHAWSLFWLGYLVLFLLLNWRTAKANRLGWCLAGVSILLCLRSYLFAQTAMSVLTALAIPMLLMLHAQVASGKAEEDRDGLFGLLWLEGWFVQPFRSMGTLFTTIGKLFQGKRSSLGTQILLGVVIAIPVLLVISFLLVGADGVIAFYTRNFFESFNPSQLFWNCVGIFLATLLFGSFLYQNTLGRKDRRLKQPVKTYWNPVTVSVLLGLLLVVYALFTFVQFTYLFGKGGLPDGLTYAQYARSGFMQLMLVAVLNLTTFGLCLRYAHPHPCVRGMLVGLLAATAVVLVSGFTRLGMYISAYGLTWMRLLPLSFMIALSVLVALAAVRIWLPRLRLLRVGAAVLVVWFLLLGFGNPEALIAQVNLNRLEAGEKVSVEYLSQLSSDAVGTVLRHAAQHPSADVDQILMMQYNHLRYGGIYTLSDSMALNRLQAYFKNHTPQ